MARRGLLVLGLLLIAAGIFWALQGAGVVMWPAESFMLRQESWVTYGIVTALIGIAVIGLSRRSR
jgi:hypothetical protein